MKSLDVTTVETESQEPSCWSRDRETAGAKICEPKKYLKLTSWMVDTTGHDMAGIGIRYGHGTYTRSNRSPIAWSSRFSRLFTKLVRSAEARPTARRARYRRRVPIGRESQARSATHSSPTTSTPAA